MRKFKYNDLLEVIWLDAETTAGWVNEAEARKPPHSTFLTVGFYTAHDKDYLYLSWVIGLDNTKNKNRAKEVIPLGCIKKIKKIPY